MTGRNSLRFCAFVDHHAPSRYRSSGGSHSSTSTPIGFRPVYQIGPVRERAHEGNREPVARRLAHLDLILHVVRQVRQRITLGFATLRRNLFVAARKRNRLERKGEQKSSSRLSSANSITRPTCSLNCTPLMIVITGTACRHRSSAGFQWRAVFTSNRLPMARCEFCRTLPTPSNWKICVTKTFRLQRPLRRNSGLFANSIPLVAACTLLYPTLRE